MENNSQPNIGSLCTTNYKDRWTDFQSQRRQGTAYINLIGINFQQLPELFKVLSGNLSTSMVERGRRELNGEWMSSTRVVRINTADAGQGYRRNLDLLGPLT